MGYKGNFYKFFIVLIISKLQESHLKILIFCNLTHIETHHPTKKTSPGQSPGMHINFDFPLYAERQN